MRYFRSKISKIISWAMIFALLNINFSCYYYTNKIDTHPTTEKLDVLKNSPNYMIIHQGDLAYYLSNVKVDQQNQQLSGVLLALPPDHLKYKDTKPEPGSANRYIKSGSSKKKVYTPHVINEVHLYVHDLILQENTSLTIPIALIEKIEVYDPDTGATTASWVFGTIGVVAGVFVLIIVVVLLTKSSCPFIYIDNGEEFVFAGEIYSGAIFKSIERDDYLLLPKTTRDTLEIIVSNKLKEKQFINQLRLLEVRHPSGTRILPDRLGNAHLIRKPVNISHAEVGLEDVTSLLEHHDNSQFTFNVQHRDDYFNEVIITFPKDDNAKEGHLVLNAKNSLWGDYVFGEFTKLFGKKYTSWVDKQNKKAAPDMKGWTADQGLAMKVYIEKGNEWKLVDNVDLVGPLAYRDLVVPINLNGHTSDIIKIKLTAGFMLWDLDYVGMDYSADDGLEVRVINPSSAITHDGENVLAQITSTNEAYLAQKKTGDEAYVSFPLGINNTPEVVRNYILHSRGYYNHVREYTQNTQLPTLLSFKLPGRFSKFSKEKLDEMNLLLPVVEISALAKLN